MPTKKIYTNTLAQIGGKVATALISIFLIKILTGYLDVAWYGLYSKIYNYLSIFAVIADLGLYTITVRELTKYQHDRVMTEKISGNILSLRTVSGLLIILLSLAIAPWLAGYNSSEALLAIGIVAVFTLFWLINSSIMSSLQAMLKTEFSFVANTAGKLLTFWLIASFAYILLPNDGTISHEMRLMATVLAGLAGNILMTGLTWWYAHKWYRIKFAWDTDYILHILKISLPYWLALFLGVIFFKVDIILLSIMEPREDADTVIALYSLPMKIVEVGMMYGTVFLNSVLPVLTSAIEENRVEDTKKLTKKGFELLMGFGAGISVFLAFFAPEVIRLISTDDFVHTSMYGYTAVDAMRIVAWIFLFYFISSLSNYTLIAKGEQKKIMYVNTLIAIVNIVGNILVIPHYSFIGSAWVTLLSQVLLVIITWYLVRASYENRAKIQQSALFIILAVLSWIIAYWIAHTLISSDMYNLRECMIRSGIGAIVFWVLYLMGWWGMRRITLQSLR